MNYSQKIQKRAQEIQHLSDEFHDVRATLSILKYLNPDALLGESIQMVVYQALEIVDAIEVKIEQSYTEKE